MGVHFLFWPYVAFWSRLVAQPTILWANPLQTPAHGRGLHWWGAKKLWLFPHILRSEKGQRSQIYFLKFFSLMICWKFLNLLLEGKMFIFNVSLYHNFENVVQHSIFLFFTQGWRRRAQGKRTRSKKFLEILFDSTFRLKV